jgi:RNA polymerase sigma factor (sigma-70 family)
VDSHLAARPPLTAELDDTAAPGDLEESSSTSIDLARALGALDERDRELLSLRYGADLSARQIGELLEQRTNTIEVALHRALGRLRSALERNDPDVAKKRVLKPEVSP